MLHRFLWLIIMFAWSSAGYCQNNNSKDTLFYDQDWRTVAPKDAYYFRPPPSQDGNKVKLVFYHVGSRQKISEGYEIKGAREGEWIFYFEGSSKIKSKENYVNGLMDGPSTYYDPETQQVVAEGYSRKGKSHGWHKAFFSNNNVSQEGYLFEDIPVGEWKHYYMDGGLKGIISHDSSGLVLKVTDYDSITHKRTIETNEFREDTVRNGIYKYYHENGETIQLEGRYINDKRDGIWKSYFLDGSLYIVSNYANDLSEGYSFANDSVTGKKKVEGYYHKDQKDGKWQYYNSSGVLFSVENYKDGKLHGNCYLYDTITHKLSGEGECVRNKRKGAWKYYYAGTDKLRFEEHYRNDLLDGNMTTYDTHGNKIEEIHYAEGRKNGVGKYYYTNGEVWLKLNFKNDSLDGKMETYYLGGKKKRVDIYAHGALVDGHCYSKEGEETAYSMFYSEPEFPGDIMTYIGNNLQYPAEARAEKIEGKVLIRFTVKKDGTLADIEAIEKIGYGCDEEAIRLFATMPLWTPGQFDGDLMSIQKTFPVVFWLPEEQPDIE